MKAATAQEIRSRKIFVSIPGTDPVLRLECRRPDPLELITQGKSTGLLAFETYGAVLEELGGMMQEINRESAVLDNRKVGSTGTAPKTYNEFLDAWAMFVTVSPKLVATEEDAIYDPSALWVKELDTDVKAEIFGKTRDVLASDRVLRAVRSFRLDRSTGAGAGPNGEAVQLPPVEPAPDR